MRERESDEAAWGGRGPSASYAGWKAEGQPRADLAAALVEEALFLRMNGERPPGAPADPRAETWAAWDRRAEEFLRGLARGLQGESGP